VPLRHTVGVGKVNGPTSTRIQVVCSATAFRTA
jgi:hypothetical protein